MRTTSRYLALDVHTQIIRQTATAFRVMCSHRVYAPRITSILTEFRLLASGVPCHDAPKSWCTISYMLYAPTSLNKSLTKTLALAASLFPCAVACPQVRFCVLLTSIEPRALVCSSFHQSTKFEMRLSDHCGVLHPSVSCLPLRLTVSCRSGGIVASTKHHVQKCALSHWHSRHVVRCRV